MIKLFNNRRWVLLLPSALLLLVFTSVATGSGSDQQQAGAVLSQTEVPCAYPLNPAGRLHNYDAEFSTFIVTAAVGCDWTVENANDWMAIKLATNGTGNGIVRYSVFVNPSPFPRTGSLTVNGQVFTVTQLAAPCNFSILPANYLLGAGGGSGSVTVFASEGCAWAVSNTNLWITITSATNSSGGGVMNYSVAPNYDASDRSGVIILANQPFAVTQFGTSCRYAISATNRSHTFGVVTGAVTVTADIGCPWNLVNTNDWIVLGSGPSRLGSGSVPYTIHANSSSIARTGLVGIANQFLALGQAGLPCSPAIAPLNRLHGFVADAGFVAVTAPIGCHWTVQTPNNWIVPTSSLTGVSNGVVTYQVQPNPGPPRTGILLVGSSQFIVQQGAASPPLITGLSASQSVVAGVSVVFSVSASGSGPLSYQWQWNGVNLTDGPTVTGAATPRLILPSVQSSQQGNYSVVVSNLRGPVASPPVLLMVNTPPILAPIGDQTISQGAPLVVKALAIDGDLPPQVLIYSLDAGAPSGATLDPATGLFTWGSAQGPSTNRITIRVTDNGSPSLSAAQTFSISVLTAPLTNLTLVATGFVWKYRDTGQDLGVAWTAMAFDDRAWTSGPARLGYGSGGEATVVSYGPSSSAKYMTTYFRAAFNVPNPSLFTALNLRVLRDDGVVVYLNGFELYRDNMPSGPITFRTPAAASVSSSARTNYFASPPLPAGSLVAGQNVLAVEIHKRSAGNSVLGFDLEMDGNRSFITPAVLVQPQSQSIPAGGAATLSVTAVGALPLRHQWYFQGRPLPNATNASLSLANVPLSQAGGYSVLVTNVLGSASSDVVTLTVLPNTPPLLTAPGDQTVNEGALLTLSTSATDSDLPAQFLTYSLDPGAPPGAAINPTNGVFTWMPTEAQGPSTNVVTIRVTDNGSPPMSDFKSITIIANEVNTAPILAVPGIQTINEGSLLTFTTSATDSDLPAQFLTYSLDPGAPPGAAINPTNGVFIWVPTEAQGPSTNVVTIRVTDNGFPALSDFKTITIIVNEVNTAPALAAIADKAVVKGGLLTFTASATDADIPAQKLTYSLAAGAPGGASINPATGLFMFTALNAQVLSTNKVTITVNDNGAPALSDSKTFTVFVVPGFATNVSLISTGSVWKYRDTGEDLGGAWIAPAFNDTAWNRGPGVLGYGAGDESTIVGYGPNSSAKYITTYFRRAFQVMDPSLFNLLSLRVRRDDGVVIFLNGAEVFRDNLPAGPITYLTPASTSASGTNKTTYHVSGPLDPSTLVAGTNVVAAEVHQRSGSSSAMDFDLELSGIAAKPDNAPPVLAKIGDKTVLGGSLLTFTAKATDSDVPAQVLTYSLDAGAPSEAGIDPEKGLFTWVPTATGMTGPHQITVRVTDSGSPALNDFETIDIEVRELTLAMDITNGASGTQVSLPLHVNSFSGISSFQFSLHWDPTVATFLGVEQFGLVGMNFGTTATNEGTLVVSWDELTGRSASLADGATLFASRLLLAGMPGANSDVWIDGAPTMLEAANGNLQVVPLNASPGHITIDNSITNPGPLAAHFPPLTRIALGSGGEVAVRWNASPGKMYRLQYTTNLSAKAWTDAGPDVLATGSQASAIDTPRDGMAQRFYRVIQLGLDEVK